MQLGDLGDREHARQHHALDAELLAIEPDRLGRGGAGLHRQMQPQVRIVARGVIGDAHVGDDHRVDAELGRAVDGVAPHRELAGRRKGVDREQQLGVAGVRIGERLLDLGEP